MKIDYRISFSAILLVWLGLSLTACGPLAAVPISGDVSGLEIVVTTTFIGDVVGRVAGENPDITILLEPGQNPHSYQPTPQDMVKISRADVIFVNGFELEEFLDDLLDGSGTEAELVVVSETIQPLGLTGLIDEEDEDHQEDNDHDHQMGLDPHVWFDPNNLMIWTDNIVEALARLDPSRAAEYSENGQNYQDQLTTLDTWIRTQIDRIPAEDRKLVTDHTSLGYFAEQYGFEQIGAVIPALTTEAETSGQELARLIDTIRETQVKAIFVGVDFDPTLARRVAEETGVDLVPLYFGSLSEGDPAGTYLDFMRYDVEAIVNALQ